MHKAIIMERKALEEFRTTFFCFLLFDLIGFLIKSIAVSISVLSRGLKGKIRSILNYRKLVS